jgi:short-subunit dehydrogenase
MPDLTFKEKYGPWALITGASEGTGAAFALQLGEAGINCVLIARREAQLAELAARVKAKGVECVAAPVDLSAQDASAQVLAAAGDRDIGLLIANAGADPNSSRFLDNDAANWEKLITLNILTTMRNCHHFGQEMRVRGRGGIILVGSGACYGGLHGMGVYCGVKAFDMCFAEGLWAEMRHVGVDVLNLVLGRTDTPAHRATAAANGQPFDATGMARAEDVARIGLEQLPHGPIYNWGQANDIAGYAPNSPDERRARILKIEELSGGAYLKTRD